MNCRFSNKPCFPGGNHCFLILEAVAFGVCCCYVPKNNIATKALTQIPNNANRLLALFLKVNTLRRLTCRLACFCQIPKFLIFDSPHLKHPSTSACKCFPRKDYSFCLTCSSRSFRNAVQLFFSLSLRKAAPAMPTLGNCPQAFFCFAKQRLPGV